MNKLVRFLAGSFFAAMLLIGSLPLQVQAANRTYTVAIRSGNAGNFNVAAVQNALPSATVDEGYIKLEVKRGETLADYFASDDALNNFLSNQNYLKTESVEGGSYSALPVEGFSVTDPITRNTDVVVSYCRIVNPARYVIQYVNGETDADIAAPVFGLGEAGEKITASPLTITGYTAPAGGAQVVTLEEGKTALIKFRYSQNEQIVYNTEITYTDGETVYNDIINRIGQTYVVDQGAAGAGEELVEVNEAETPLANQTLEDNGLVEIEDTETPLANKTLGNSVVFAMLVAVALVSVAMATYIIRRNNKKKVQ